MGWSTPTRRPSRARSRRRRSTRLTTRREDAPRALHSALAGATRSTRTSSSRSSGGPGAPRGILHRLGVDRPRLVRALAARGVAVPPGEPEPLDLRPTRRIDVPFEHLSTIVSELPRRLPAGTRFGFNLDPDTERAWIFVGEEIDAEPVVAALLGEEDARDG